MLSLKENLEATSKHFNRGSNHGINVPFLSFLFLFLQRDAFFAARSLKSVSGHDFAAYFAPENVSTRCRDSVDLGSCGRTVVVGPWVVVGHTGPVQVEVGWGLMLRTNRVPTHSGKKTWGQAWTKKIREWKNICNSRRHFQSCGLKVVLPCVLCVIP